MKGLLDELGEILSIKEAQIQNLKLDLDKVTAAFSDELNRSSSELKTTTEKLLGVETALKEQLEENKELKNRVISAELALTEIYEQVAAPLAGEAQLEAQSTPKTAESEVPHD